MTTTLAEMRAAVAAQRQGPERCPCGGPVWTIHLVVHWERSLERADLRRGIDTSRVADRVEGCRLCTMPDMRWTEAHNREYDRWRLKFDEANAWCDPTAHDLYGQLDDIERARIERGGRPRAIVEVGPEPGSAEAREVLERARFWLANEFQNGTDEYAFVGTAVSCDAVMERRRQEGPPAFTEVDRYDPQTGEPKRGYLNDRITALMEQMGREFGQHLADTWFNPAWPEGVEPVPPPER